jgi:toxin ParE1/3/4
MAHKIIWSPGALRELREIAEYISIDSKTYAANVAAKIMSSVDNLELFPLMGRRVPEFNQDDFREILVLSWRIVYRISEYDIEIVEIIHGAQRWRG